MRYYIAKATSSPMLLTQQSCSLFRIKSRGPTMTILGLGGIFIKAKDPTALRQGYEVVLGLKIELWPPASSG